MGQEIFPVMRGGAGIGQEKSIRGGDEDPILRPRSAPLPSLCMSLHVVSQTLERLVNLGVKKTEVSFIDDGEFFTVQIP